MRAAVARLAEDIAGASAARATWLVPARHVPDLLSKLGLIGRADRLVVFADDFTDVFLERFPRQILSFASAPTPEAFRRAQEAAERPVPAVSGTPASYAHAPGRSAERTFWFVNSIGGRGLRVPDLRVLAQEATASGAVLVVDNTVASFFCCRPLMLGATVCLESLDRAAAGALERTLVAVSVAPAVSGRGRRRRVNPAAEDAYRLLTMRLGEPGAQRCPIPAADLAALADGLATLPERMQAHVDHARAIAAYLACHHAVAEVAYPGLAGHPDRGTAATVLEHGFGLAVDFRLPVEAGAFIDACSAANRTAPAGGAATRMSARDGAEAQFIRLFAGTDDPLDIVDSLDQALRLFCNPPEP